MSKTKVVKADYQLVQHLKNAGFKRGRIQEMTRRSWNVVNTLYNMDEWSPELYRETYDREYNQGKFKDLLKAPVEDPFKLPDGVELPPYFPPETKGTSQTTDDPVVSVLWEITDLLTEILNVLDKE